MDGVDPELVDAAEVALAAEPGVTEVRSVKMRWIGHRLHADAGRWDGDELLPALRPCR